MTLATAPTSSDQQTRASVARLHRRAGFGLHPDELAPASASGVDVALDTLLSTEDDQPDAWEGLALDPQDGGRPEAIRAWATRLLTTTSPYIDRRTWMLHGWLVSAMDKAPPPAMVEQIRLLAASGGESMPDLLRAITTDRAMLLYLDGRTSTAEAPNENYGRELLELFALGVGEQPDGSGQPYTEADVLAAATALTGWIVTRQDGARFVARRHDDTPQTLLGVSGVDDVDSVIDAIVAHPAHARFVARRVASEYIGDPTDPALDDVVDTLAGVYLDNEMSLDPVIEAALRLVAASTSTPLVQAPIPWMIATARALDIGTRQFLVVARESVRNMGQTPMYPPSVAGWPGGIDWLTTGSLIARTAVADAFAAAASDDQPLLLAFDDGDLDEAAAILGVTSGFGATTSAAIRGADSPRSALTLALVSPEGLLS